MKLAHARYLAEGWPVRILGFRQQTYHADYEEPRAATRSELLEASYRSALDQCAKAGISTQASPFILEDSSVRINALSSASTEVPGLDVKFWMREQDFGSLDAQLRSRGNDRRAEVRSDLLLHVPPLWRKAWGVESDYVVFVGTQRGTIVDREFEFRANPVFPWLDDQSFNKWFQPERTIGPLGGLDIAAADTVDFRRKSFEQLFHFLGEHGYLANSFEQLDLQLYSSPNFILCGYTCAGKTTASQHLTRRFGYLHIEASDFMHLSYLYRHGYNGPVSISDFAELALAQKPTIAAEKVAEYVAANPHSPVVISGFRSPAEVEFLRQRFGAWRKFDVHFIDADESCRFRRLQQRGRPGDLMSWEDFQKSDCQQNRMGLSSIREQELASIVANDTTIDAFLRKIDGLVGDSVASEIDVTLALQAAAFVTDVRLEDAILVALLSVWREGEDRPFHTTTRIAALIKETLPAVIPAKHKDNVSRYFNQDFYASYEISNGTGSSARRYRLSNTGYGRAIQALRQMLLRRDFNAVTDMSP